MYKKNLNLVVQTDCNLKLKQILINHNEDYWNGNDFILSEVLYDLITGDLWDLPMCHLVTSPHDSEGS